MARRSSWRGTGQERFRSSDKSSDVADNCNCEFAVRVDFSHREHMLVAGVALIRFIGRRNGASNPGNPTQQEKDCVTSIKLSPLRANKAQLDVYPPLPHGRAFIPFQKGRLMNTSPANDALELALIELEYASADFGARKALITKLGDLEALLSKLVGANRAVQTALAALGRLSPAEGPQLAA